MDARCLQQKSRRTDGGCRPCDTRFNKFGSTVTGGCAMNALVGPITSRPGTRFWIALAHGLGWGVFAASICGGVTMAFASLAANTATEEALRQTFETTIWTAFGATLFAIFPIGPIAGVAGWLLYRRGV